MNRYDDGLLYIITYYFIWNEDSTGKEIFTFELKRDVKKNEGMI